MEQAIMLRPSHQRCAQCGTTYGELDPRTRCECGGLLEIVHPRETEDGAMRRAFDARASRALPGGESGV